MVENDWFVHKLNVLKDDYLRRDKENLQMLMASYEGRAKDKDKHDELIRHLCRSLERAQEVILMLGEQSGKAELLKEAKVYANAIGGVTEPFNHYADNPVVKKHFAKPRVKKARSKKK